MTEVWSGGCQCGAVRYRFTSKPKGAHICHCRMCQKAFGAFYAPLVGGLAKDFEVTRGEVAIFKSSENCQRGFCQKCGTPLSFAFDNDDWMSVSIGSLDDPSAFPPKDQHGKEGRHAFVNGLGDLPDNPSTESREPDRSDNIAKSNRQHPDHDTNTWPEQEQSI